MATWVVYGDAWYAMRIEADSQEDAEVMALSNLAKFAGGETMTKLNIQWTESELADA